MPRQEPRPRYWDGHGSHQVRGEGCLLYFWMAPQTNLWYFRAYNKGILQATGLVVDYASILGEV